MTAHPSRWIVAEAWPVQPAGASPARWTADAVRSMTPHETDVWRLIAGGLSSSEIAGRLYVTEDGQDAGQSHAEQARAARSDPSDRRLRSRACRSTQAELGDRDLRGRDRAATVLLDLNEVLGEQGLSGDADARNAINAAAVKACTALADLLD